MISIAVPFPTPCGGQFPRPGVNSSKATLSRELRWRQTLVQQIDARPNETIADVGCGAGELAVMLKLNSPATCVYGFDPNPSALDRAERRSYIAGAMVHYVYATLDDIAEKLSTRMPTQIICSRVFHRLSLIHKRQLLEAMFEALPRDGNLHVANTSWHRPSGMLGGFPLALAMRAGATTQSSASGRILTLMRDSGFVQCRETSAASTVTGPISLYRGVKS